MFVTHSALPMLMCVHSLSEMFSDIHDFPFIPARTLLLAGRPLLFSFIDDKKIFPSPPFFHLS